MDLTIQSLVQSPYMRAMAVVPTKSEELVHGISDHLPPLVKTQLTIPPTRNPGISGKWTFNIPRRGFWHSATLVVRPRVTDGATLPGSMYPFQYESASTFVEAVTDIELYSKQRFLERLIPEAICSEMLSNGDKNLQWYQKTYAAFDALIPEYAADSIPWPYIASNELLGGLSSRIRDNARSRPHYIIPLPLASFTSVKKNIQTLFVENLSLVVTTKNFGFLEISGYDMELRCEFHAFHPNVETVIRNANYKQGIPATLPWHDWIHFDTRINPSDSRSVQYALESDALISKLLVIPQWEHRNSKVKTLVTMQNFYIVITSVSEVLFESSVADLDLRYDLILDEDANTNYPDKTLDAAYSYYIPINFGLRRDNERFTGGLALSSLTNARIAIYPNEYVYRTGTLGMENGLYFPVDNDYHNFDFKVIGKRHFFMRIDSDTGVMTRSIES